MLSQLTLLASEEGPHISLKAEPFIKLGDYTITNSMVYGAILMITLLLVMSYVARKITVKPKRGVTSLFELIVEYMLGVLESVFGSRKKAVKFAPVFSIYFIMIMFSNLSGLLPIVGEGITANGTPAFRPFTADLNSVAALSVFSIVLVQILSIKENGLKGHLGHYFTDKPLNPINIFVGLLEMSGELTRIISLSLRLFLNTVIGEILVSVFIYISGPGTPLALIPIILFEGLVAYIQAYVFTVLSATYLALATTHHEDHQDPPPNQLNPLSHSKTEPEATSGGVTI